MWWWWLYPVPVFCWTRGNSQSEKIIRWREWRHGRILYAASTDQSQECSHRLRPTFTCQPRVSKTPCQSTQLYETSSSTTNTSYRTRDLYNSCYNHAVAPTPFPETFTATIDLRTLFESFSLDLPQRLPLSPLQ